MKTLCQMCLFLPVFRFLGFFWGGNLSSKSQVKKERKSKLYDDIECGLITDIKQKY